MASRAVPWLALLLICIAVGKPGSSQEQDKFPGACPACKYIVKWIQRQIGKDSSKEKIGALLNRACLSIKKRILQRACKWLMKRLKNKLINAIANHGTPQKVCQDLKLCKRTLLLHYIVWQ